MEELCWGNPSAASTLLNSLGLPSPLWSTLTAHESSQDFPTPSDFATAGYYPQDVTDNPMEYRRIVDQNVDLDNEFHYNIGSISAVNGKDEQEEFTLLSNAYCLKRPSVLQEQALENQLPALVDPLNRVLSSAYNTMNATAGDEGISSQIQIINDPESSIISSNKIFWTASWGGGAISSDSTEQDEAVSQSSSLQLVSKKRKSPEPIGCSFNLKGEKYLCFNAFQSDFSLEEGGFKLITEDYSAKQKKPRSEKPEKSSNINFLNPNSLSLEPDTEAIATMKEMIYRAAALRPINLAPEIIEKPKRKNVRISCDPQTVAARQRRERISDRIRILQRLVPGGNKMDTATMLDEAANYLKFLKSQVSLLQSLGTTASNSMNYQHDQSPAFTIPRS